MIFHITSATEWAAAQLVGTYAPPSLAAEGFIHLSTQEQTLATAARYYAEASDLVLVWVDEDLLTHELRWEAPPDPARSHERYPHLYGPLDFMEVIDVRPFTRNDHGDFVFPY
jgi:uncharacterized protein (DUF952 family)